jgi:ribosome biogenesis GTPase A
MIIVNPKENIIVVNDFDKLKQQVLNKVKHIGISKNTLHLFIQVVIETVENSGAKGDTKKELAIHIMRDLVELIPQSGEKEYILELIHNGTIANMIDLVVLASRGEVNINKVINVSKNCCFGFFKKQS